MLAIFPIRITLPIRSLKIWQCKQFSSCYCKISTASKFCEKYYTNRIVFNIMAKLFLMTISSLTAYVVCFPTKLDMIYVYFYGLDGYGQSKL